MSPEVVQGIVLFGGLLVLLFLGVHIAWAFGVMAAIGLLWIGQPLSQFGDTAWWTTFSYVMITMPLFIFMGEMLQKTGISEKLFKGVEPWLSWMPGGLAVVTIGSLAVFGAMSGSNLASVAVFSKISMPVLEKKGYDPRLALGSIGAGSLLDPLIPPSLLMIVYGTWFRVSVLELFAGGLIPGIVLAALLIAFIAIRVKIDPGLAPRATEKYSWKDRFDSIKETAPAALIVLAVLGSMFAGITTPTESAALGIFATGLLGLAYKKLNWNSFVESAKSSVKTTSMIMFIMATALAFIHVLNFLGITREFKDYLVNWQVNKYIIIALFLLMYLIVGMFSDAWSMLFLTGGFVVPTLIAVGVSPVWWGVVYMIAAGLSNITPPYGFNLFILKSLLPKYSMGTIIRGCLPFLIPFYIWIALMVMFPEVVMFLPNLLRGK